MLETATFAHTPRRIQTRSPWRLTGEDVGVECEDREPSAVSSFEQKYSSVCLEIKGKDIVLGAQGNAGANGTQLASTTVSTCWRFRSSKPRLFVTQADAGGPPCSQAVWR